MLVLSSPHSSGSSGHVYCHSMLHVRASPINLWCRPGVMPILWHNCLHLLLEVTNFGIFGEQCMPLKPWDNNDIPALPFQYRVPKQGSAIWPAFHSNVCIVQQFCIPISCLQDTAISSGLTTLPDAVQAGCVCNACISLPEASTGTLWCICSKIGFWAKIDYSVLIDFQNTQKKNIITRRALPSARMWSLIQPVVLK